jgi:glycosyltransferase involved in cell wall biosynthesis
VPEPDHRPVGYVVKRYPVYSETFIVNEILAHEAAGISIEVFALKPTVDGHFQDRIARVRARVNYLPSEAKSGALWHAMEQASAVLPNLWSVLEAVRGEDSNDVYQALVLARHVALNGVRHLHAHFATSATSVARIAARLAGVPYTFTAHAKDIFHDSVRPDDLRRKLHDATGVITVSDFNLVHLRQTFGFTAARVRRVYNGLDLVEFPYQPPRDRHPRIVAVGRLVEKKGFSDLVEACAILAGRNRRFHCQIVGAGNLEAELRGQIVEHQLQACVELLGPRPQAEVLQLIQEAAVFAAPCVIGTDGNRDGLPTVLLEAMALGTPCVATDVTGIPEVLQHEKTGLMVPQHDPPALASAIERLLSDERLGVQLAGHARQLIESDFDIHQNTAHIRAIFQTVGGRHVESHAAPLQEVAS